MNIWSDALILKTRLLLSGVFQVLRLLAAAITIYGVSAMIDLITGIGFLASVLIFGAFTVLYDVLGGIRAVIWSDVLQMAILVSVLGYLLWLLVGDAGGLKVMLSSVSGDRLAALDFGHHGLGDGHDFAFWPMLIGGFFSTSRIMAAIKVRCRGNSVPKTKKMSDDPAAEWFAAFSAGLALLPDRRRYRGLRRKS